MVKGIGNDIVAVERIAHAVERYGQRFLDRVFTKREQEYCLGKAGAKRHLAGRFAAKEAVVKALGTGFSNGLTWQDVEVVNDAYGKPVVTLSLAARQRFHDPVILLSISHCREYAAAVAIAE